jgi:chromosome segregation ATPase
MKTARIPTSLFAALLVFTAVAGAGCSPKGATDMAIKATESAYAPVKEKLTNAMPDEAKAIEAKIAAAKDNMAKGEYKAALEGIKDVPTEIKDLEGKIDAKMAELKTSWDGLATAVPTAQAALSAQVDKLAKMKKLPKGMEPAALDQAKSDLAQGQQAWTDAQSAQSGGKMAEAVEKAGEAEKAFGNGMSALGSSMADAGDVAKSSAGK